MCGWSHKTSFTLIGFLWQSGPRAVGQRGLLCFSKANRIWGHENRDRFSWRGNFATHSWITRYFFHDRTQNVDMFEIATWPMWKTQWSQRVKTQISSGQWQIHMPTFQIRIRNGTFETAEWRCRRVPLFFGPIFVYGLNTLGRSLPRCRHYHTKCIVLPSCTSGGVHTIRSQGVFGRWMWKVPQHAHIAAVGFRLLSGACPASAHNRVLITLGSTVHWSNRQPHMGLILQSHGRTLTSIPQVQFRSCV